MHLDIKPKNIVIKNGDIRLIDFGVSRIYPDRKITSRSGTRIYQPPEIYEEHDGYQADIWAMTVTLLEMVFGRYKSQDMI